MSSIGAPAPPNPPIITDMPSSMPATASSMLGLILFMFKSRCLWIAPRSKEFVLRTKVSYAILT